MADVANLGLSYVANEQKLGNEGMVDTISSCPIPLTRSSVMDGPFPRSASHDQPIS